MREQVRSLDGQRPSRPARQGTGDGARAACPQLAPMLRSSAPSYSSSSSYSSVRADFEYEYGAKEDRVEG